MNLVQINERLKEMPTQALQQYANGSNPSVPPYLALGEIQRREKIKQQMAMEQGAAQGQQPSVKEQIEQKAGLMGLQQAQMQQQQAAQMQPRPGPVPAGTPQPQAQPQPEEMAMASGGVARLPVRNDLYRFANGGIIAFQEGGQPPRVITIPAGTSDEEIDRIRRENPDAILRPEAQIERPAQQPPQMQPQPAQKPGIAGLQQSPLMQEALAAAREKPVAPTAAGVIEQQNALLPPELQEEARLKRAQAAQARMDESKKAFEASRPGGLDQLIKVFGQAGQYKGMSGLGPAYTQNRERMAAEEAAFRREQEGMRSKAEEQQLGEAGALFKARSTDMAGQNEAYRKQLASRTESLSQLAGVDQRSIDAQLDRMSQAELTKLRIAAEKANAQRPGAGERITAQILKLRSEGKIKEADELLQTYSQVAGSGAAGVGGQRNELMRLKAAQAGYKELMENGDTDAERAEGKRNYLRITKQLAGMEETGGEPSMTMEDVRATAKASGKTEAEVIAAAKARGYTIQ